MKSRKPIGVEKEQKKNKDQSSLEFLNIDDPVSEDEETNYDNSDYHYEEQHKDTDDSMSSSSEEEQEKEKNDDFDLCDEKEHKETSDDSMWSFSEEEYENEKEENQDQSFLELININKSEETRKIQVIQDQTYFQFLITEDSEEAVEQIFIYCKFCNKQYKHQAHLDRHQENAHKEGVKIVKKKGDKNLHMRKHQESRKFNCKFCSKTFKLLKAKVAHESLHSGERSFICDFMHCNDSFRTYALLAKHTLKHQEAELTQQVTEKMFKFIFTP